MTNFKAKQQVQRAAVANQQRRRRLAERAHPNATLWTAAPFVLESPNEGLLLTSAVSVIGSSHLSLIIGSGAKWRDAALRALGFQRAALTDTGHCPVSSRTFLA